MKSIVLVLLAVLAGGAILIGNVHAATGPGVIDFAGPAAIVELKDRLSPYHAPSGPEADGSRWYMFTADNGSVKPSTRVLLAGQPVDAILRVWPLSARPYIVQVAASDSQVIVEAANAHGRHAIRVTIPPATTVTLAIRLAYADSPPSVLAWTEPALVSHNRQMGIFIAAVAGMIAAAMAIILGLAVMTGHPAPFWASGLLILIFVLRLAVTGTLDSGWATHLGGPFGFEVALTGLALAVGLRLSDTVVPIETIWPRGRGWFHRLVLAQFVLSILAFLGVPGAMLATDITVVLGTTAITVYFVHRGRRGEQAARVAAPSAVLFSLVALGAAAVALGAFSDNQAAPAIVGGFMAAGAVLLALAVAAGEGIAILPASRYGRPPDGGQGAHPETPEPPAPTNAAKAIGASHQGVFDLDFATQTVHLSREAAVLTGMPSGVLDVPHGQWVERVHPDDRSIYQSTIASYRAQAGIAFRLEFRLRADQARYSWFEIRASMLGEGAQADRCLGLLADVTARKEVEAVSSERSSRDILTGLGNRIGLMEALDRLGPKIADITFALLDIDRFKSVHASLGDEGADGVLAMLAARLVERFSKAAEIFRVGGDAFALVFAHNSADPATLGADLVETCKSPFVQQGRSIFAPASVGLAAGRDSRDPLDLLKNAELALLQAKRQGGSCARVYTAALEALAPGDAVALEADLREALNQDQLDVYYQPIVRLSDGTVAGFEALMRWQHPRKGLIEPSSFVAHCEETGLIVAIGQLALKRAAEDLSQWQRFFPVDPPLFTSVNLSRRQLLDAEFEGILGDVLARHAIKPGTLKLEVTENAVAIGTDTHEALARLRAAGASLAIDDFGTGVSNFQQLKDIPFDTLKLDRSFLVRRGNGRDDNEGAVILGSIVNLAHDLDRDVVIEGVETAAEADWLRALGCEYGQGFYFSAPIPREQVLDFIARHFRIETGQA